MFCSHCGNQFNGQFCPKCGTKAINFNKFDDSEISNEYIDTTSTNTAVKKGAVYYIWWVLCVCFVMSGVVLFSLKEMITGITWLIGGIVMCPEILKNCSAGIRFLIAIILITIGTVLME